MLVLDSDDNGVDFYTNFGGGASYWDIDNDGYAELTAWPKVNNLRLAIDLNKNGYIDNQSELFGDDIKNGFESLSRFDFNHDEKISPEDDIWDKLQIWLDKNFDGFSQPEELSFVKNYNLTWINLNADPLPSDNQTRVTHIGKVYYKNDVGKEAYLNLYSVKPIYSDFKTVYREQYKIDARSIFLPTLRGFGTLPDLHIALSKDNNEKDSTSLLSLEEKLSTKTLQEYFDLNNDIEDQFEALLFRWARVDALSPSSRGPNIDARKLAFLEALRVLDFIQTDPGDTSDLLSDTAYQINRAYIFAYNFMYNQFFLQVYGNDIYTAPPVYSIMQGGITGVEALKIEGIPQYLTQTIQSNKSLDKNQIFTIWSRYIRLLTINGAIPKLSSQERKILDSEIAKVLPDENVTTLFVFIKKFPRDKKRYDLSLKGQFETALKNIYKNWDERYTYALTGIGFMICTFAVYIIRRRKKVFY